MQNRLKSPFASMGLSIFALAGVLVLVLSAAGLASAQSPSVPPPSASASGNVGVTSAPLTLPTAIREALSGSEEALILREKDKKFEALKQQAWSAGFPQVSLNASAGHAAVPQDPSVFPKAKGTTSFFGSDPFNIEQNRFAWDLEFQQSLFTFGRLTQAIHVAGIQEQANDADRSRSLQQIQLNVLDAYYNVVTSRARLATLEASVSRAQETQAFLESNFKMGAGLRANVLRATTALKFLEPQRIRAERDAETARMALNRILGRNVDATLELDTTAKLDLPAYTAMPDSQAIASVLDGRPDLRALELNRQSLMGQAKYIRMQYLPSLAAQGKWGVTAFKLKQYDDIGNNQDWSIGVGLHVPLFDGLGLSSQAKQVESEARSLGLTARQARKMMQVEIESDYREYKAADTALAAAEQAVQAADAARAMIAEDFRAGKGQLTDLLDAEQSLREASLGVLSARYQSIRSRAALRLALGKGLVNEEAP